MKNKRVFTVRFLSPTDTRPGRATIKDERHYKRITIPMNCTDDDIKDTAVRYLESRGIKLTGFAYIEHDNRVLLFTNDFVTQIRGDK